jgi:hypothetical protein
MSKVGEISIVRGRLTKVGRSPSQAEPLTDSRHNQAEAAHQAALNEETRIKRSLQDRLDAKEKEHRRAMEQVKVEDAFRVHPPRCLAR